ncbi:AAA family ATPase, partial [Acinetobacter nematophilus]
LNYAQRVALLESVCAHLKLVVDESVNKAKLNVLDRLSAGDFAGIVRQSCFHPFENVDASVQHLADEMAVKYKNTQSRGFTASN